MDPVYLRSGDRIYHCDIFKNEKSFTKKTELLSPEKPHIDFYRSALKYNIQWTF